MLGRKGGGTPDQEREGGAPPEQEHTPFVRGLLHEIWGVPQDLHIPPLPTARQSGMEGARGEEQLGLGVGWSAPPPLGGRGTPEEQARAIVDHIVNLPSSGGLPSGQAPALIQQA